MGQPTLAAARAKSRSRNRAHAKRATASDITAEQELAMRRKARKCPLCGIRMRSEGGKPDSKELDHIIPVNVGGTHTHGNVRIICRLCNQRRPKDGSDYTGPVTLWAQGESPVRRPRIPCNKTTCRNGLHAWVPENIRIVGGKKRCAACYRAKSSAGGERERRRRQVTCKCGVLFAQRGPVLMCKDCRLAAIRQAATLRMADNLSWDAIAGLVGYGSGQGIRDAVVGRLGYDPYKRPVKPKPEPSMCGCGEPKTHGRHCDGCIWLNGMAALALRASGETLQSIADWLGYSSITSVTSLVKSVATVETRMGRPRSSSRIVIVKL